MSLTPHQDERKLSQHDDDIAAIYAKLSSIERKAERFRTELDRRFDRVESRLDTNDIGLTSLEGSVRSLEELFVHDLAGLAAHLNQLDEGLTGMDRHLTGLDTHLARMDMHFALVLQRLPGPS